MPQASPRAASRAIVRTRHFPRANPPMRGGEPYGAGRLTPWLIESPLGPLRRHPAQRRAEHADPGGDDGRVLGRPAARRRRLLDHVRARDRDRGTARPRPGDLPHRVGTGRGAGRAGDGSRRAAAGDRRRLPAGHGRMRADRAGHERRLDPCADPRLPAHRRGERDRAADPHRGRRHVPARASRARDLVRAVRLGVRRDPRPGGVRAAVLGPRAGGVGAHGAVAGRGRDQRARARARAARTARSEADRGAAGRRRRRAGGARRAAARDPRPPRRAPRRCSPRSPASG